MATAATAAKGVTSPSPFANLLRRSKFASYDPKIGQIYTTFGGDSHRGNYGLKRPLALRTREPFITVASVDSLQQQTEWTFAEKEARWIRKVAEVSKRPEDVHGSDLWKKSGPDGRFQWNVDSDFALGTTDADTALETKKESKYHAYGSTPNIDAMTPKQFKRYLEKLRTLRPAFREFLETARAKDVQKRGSIGRPGWMKIRSSNLLEQSRYETDLHNTFLSQRMAQTINDPESHVLGQDVHPNGALVYTHLTNVEDYFWRKPLPGRAVGRSRNAIVSFAGVNASLPQSKSEGILPIEWKPLVERGVDTGRGISKFRATQTEVHKPPQVVGQKPEGMADMDVRMWVSSHSRLDIVRPNPHLPWTREYVSQVSDAPVTGTRPGMTNPPPPRKTKSAYELAEASKSQEAESQRLLESLYVLLEKQQQGPPKSGGGYA